MRYLHERVPRSVAVVGNVPAENEETTVRLLKDIAKKNGHTGSKFIPFEVDVSISSPPFYRC